MIMSNLTLKRSSFLFIVMKDNIKTKKNNLSIHFPFPVLKNSLPLCKQYHYIRIDYWHIWRLQRMEERLSIKWFHLEKPAATFKNHLYSRLSSFDRPSCKDTHLQLMQNSHAFFLALRTLRESTSLIKSLSMKIFWQLEII